VLIKVGLARHRDHQPKHPAYVGRRLTRWSLSGFSPKLSSQEGKENTHIGKLGAADSLWKALLDGYANMSEGD